MDNPIFKKPVRYIEKKKSKRLISPHFVVLFTCLRLANIFFTLHSGGYFMLDYVQYLNCHLFHSNQCITQKKDAAPYVGKYESYSVVAPSRVAFKPLVSDACHYFSLSFFLTRNILSLTPGRDVSYSANELARISRLR